MFCSCSCSDNCCTTVVKVGVLPFLLGLALIVGLIKLVFGIAGNVSLPTSVWIPLIFLAAAGTIWGLWLGFRVHGRGEPIAVGVFGIGVALVGLLVYSPLIVIGVLITLVAAVWSAMAKHAE